MIKKIVPFVILFVCLLPFSCATLGGGANSAADNQKQHLSVSYLVHVSDLTDITAIADGIEQYIRSLSFQLDNKEYHESWNTGLTASYTYRLSKNIFQMQIYVDKDSNFDHRISIYIEFTEGFDIVGLENKIKEIIFDN